MAWSDNLSGVHREIAESEARSIAVLAGPGTGKTSYGMMRRVQRLLEQGVDPKTILLISFTRTAARDLREKLQTIGVSGAEKVSATTLHAFCLRLLTENDVIASTQRNPRMILDHERDLMLRDLPGDWGDLRARKKTLQTYVAGWDRGDNPHPGTAELPDDRAFEREVRDWLIYHSAMLIGEVVPIAYSYLSTDPLNEVFGKYSHILVDEYQDLNYIEQKLIDMIVSAHGVNVCVIGDDDQSIYGFRHAHPDGILSFMDRDTTRGFTISVCGRCPSQLVSMANSLISHAPNREKSPMVARDASDGNIWTIQWQSEEDEVEGIAAAVAADVRAGRFELGQILVLSNRDTGERIRKRLLDLNLDAQSYFSQEPLARDSAQLAMAYMQLILGPDRVALRVVLGAGSGDGRRAAYARLRAEAQRLGLSEEAVLQRATAGEIKLQVQIPSLIENYLRLKRGLEQLESASLEETVEQLFPSDDEGVQELRRIVLESLPLAENLAELMSKVVGRVALLEVPENPSFVRIMSFHKSKGLTADCVYIVGAIQGVLPHVNQSGTDEENQRATDEQRRLMYVAITRAKRQLVISYPRFLPMGDAKSWGIAFGRNVRGRVQTTPSVYLQEMGPDAPIVIPGVYWLQSYPPA